MAGIIIADDHPIVLSGVEAVLSAAGHVVTARADSGEAALAAGDGDLLLLDLRMPRGSGLDVLRTLCARGDQRPVILMMATIDNLSLREALDLGVNGVLLKGSAPSQLINCIEQVLDGQRWVDPSLVEQAINASRPEAGNKLAGLSARDVVIVRLVVEGLRNRDIGLRLGMTEGNVKVTLHRIYERLGVSNRVELAMLAREALDSLPPVAA